MNHLDRNVRYLKQAAFPELRPGQLTFTQNESELHNSQLLSSIDLESDVILDVEIIDAAEEADSDARAVIAELMMQRIIDSNQ